MRATIKDVSREAGVSIKTVSRVLNNERYVGQETRARVQAAVALLNFRPSTAARSLAGRRSFQIALICDNPSPYYVYEMQSGIRDRCEADGVRMIAQPYDRDSTTLLDDVESLVDATNVDGLILTPPVTDYPAVLDLLARRGVRFVRVSPGGDVDLTSSTFIDNEQAAQMMTEHLIGLGHRRIGFIAGHPSYATSGQRRNGYLKAMQATGIAPDPALMAEGSYDFASGAAAAEILLSLDVPPSAIFASSDDMAAGALTVAHRRGISVPGQLSVAGFDDTALAGFVWPPLTTIRQPTRQMAFQAADLLLAGEDAPVERREIGFELVVRDSTGPAPK
ncbi:LacI family DNA-binding transcriptional regulator [Sphingomonas sp. ERG5]|uniref:LacI family DNA-binding transcriptional regulator n=1 Tax=Sphingomonas sp. ERG5 TaxID=1381597 RepID=UPI00054BD9DF|nr:LacI family DNA-binding transcriptional regulator [Sphingomonas sp. ERG5]